MVERSEANWVSRFADEVITEADRRAPGKPVVCASGLSPSGPIHLGNLREIMMPHFVADEIRRRGRACVHLLSWDDYDRFRKVPAGTDPSWADHIGKPLTSVPAPAGSPFPNWAEHFKAPMIAALTALGIEVHGVSQTQRYTSGAYREQIVLAVRERDRISAILGRYRTKAKTASHDSAAAADDVVAGTSAPTLGDFPYKPYCSVCERDLTAVTSYDDRTTALSYICACGHSETVRLCEHNRGKLVWKVDWPMRWAYEGVVFEPSGVDHTSPSSSFVVGSQIIREVFRKEPPIGPMYAFVGISGMSKMSSSKGAVPTAAEALQIMEAPLLRWLYARRRPSQSFNVAFDQEIHRLYDEWDALSRRVGDRSASPAESATYDRATRTTSGPLPLTPRPVPYHTLVSIADITTGDGEQILRILRELSPGDPITSLAEARPRLDCATNWVNTQMPADQRIRIRDEPDLGLLAALGDGDHEMLRLLLDRLDAHWSLEGLTTLVYNVPKLRAGLPLDIQPTPQIKAVQRAFFALLYRLLIGRDTGPRLPTLLLVAGADRVRKLLNG